MKCFTHRVRAIAPDEKANRKRSILVAASNLLSKSNDQLPPVSLIAREAGLAKGTVYLYFTSKEEIFLEIVSDHYDSLLTEVATIVDSKMNADTMLDNVVNTFDRFARQRPTFLPLLSMTNSVLEQNANAEAIIRFKTMLVSHLETISYSLCLHNKELSEGEASRLLTTTNALILGLWQMHNWPEHVKNIVEKPEFRTLNSDFYEEMRYAIRALWTNVLKQTQES